MFITMLAVFYLVFTQYGPMSATEQGSEKTDKNTDAAVFQAASLSYDTGLPVQLPETEDLGLYLYRNPITRERIFNYFTDLTGSPQIADIILRHADGNNIPLSLAFSLAFAESSFNPGAVNRNTNSVDRGLFQLNSRSFPELSESDFFDPETSASYGLAYLRSCIDKGGNEIVGLAMYNAGSRRVTDSGTPKMTLDYISRILDFRHEIDDRIVDTLVKERVLVEKEKEVRYVLDTGRFNK